MTLYPIFSRKLTRKLERRGFVVVKIAPNRRYPNLNVYYFEETVELRKAVEELTTQ